MIPLLQTASYSPRLSAALVSSILVLACTDQGSKDGDGPASDHQGSPRPEATVVSASNSSPGPLKPRRRLDTSLADPLAGSSFSNVLLVTIDTWRYDAAGFSGATSANTPTLDRVASDGLQFQRAHAHTVLTFPSHVNIHTGTPPFEHGVRDNAGFYLRDSHRTLAERLEALGFTTGAMVAAFPLDSSYGLDQGFGTYDDSFPKGNTKISSMAERSGREVVDLGVRWWQQHKNKKRFLWLHLYDPHTPYAPSQADLEAADGNAYLGEVGAVDRYLTSILGPLLDGRDPAAKNTLLIITGDHGESLGEHGEATHGLFAYDATLRIPLLVWGSGIAPEITDEPASHLDIVPTVLDAVGAPKDTSLHGRSLLSTPSSTQVQSYFEALNGTLLRGWAPLRGIIDHHFKDGAWNATKYIDLPIAEVYDLDLDPGELDNLLPKAESAAARLHADLPSESQWPPQAEAISEEERKALESLGYLSGGGPANVPTSFTEADDPKNLVELDKTLQRFIDYYHTRRLDKATDTARSMVAQRPQMGLGHYHLAQVLLERGMKREALRVLSNAYRSNATTPALVRQLGLSLAEAGRASEALKVLEPLLASGDLETLLAYAQAQVETKDLAGARSTLATVLERDDENPRAFEVLGLVALQAGNWKLAEEKAQRAISLNESLALPWNYLGVARYNLGHVGPALDAWERSLELDPSDFDVLYNHAIVAAEAGRRSQAQQSLTRFIDQAPVDLYGPDIARATQLLERLQR